MRVLVATSETQGHLPGDYSWTVDGELVALDVNQCSRPDTCGCGRGFPGIASSRATTTAMVVDHPHIALADLRDVLGDWLDRSGWRTLLTADAETDDEVEQLLEDIIDEHVENITSICALFPVGTVIERDGLNVRSRMIAEAA